MFGCRPCDDEPAVLAGKSRKGKQKRFVLVALAELAGQAVEHPPL